MRVYKDIIAWENGGRKRWSAVAVKNVGNEKCN